MSNLNSEQSILFNLFIPLSLFFFLLLPWLYNSVNSSTDNASSVTNIMMSTQIPTSLFLELFFSFFFFFFVFQSIIWDAKLFYLCYELCANDGRIIMILCSIQKLVNYYNGGSYRTHMFSNDSRMHLEISLKFLNYSIRDLNPRL